MTSHMSDARGEGRPPIACRIAALLASAVALLVPCPPAEAQEAPRPELHARRAAVPPILDGVLDDAVWSGDPVPMETWVSYNPLRGEPALERTSVWIGYDEEAIYFAFKCFDSEPEGIRTTISRRDNAWNDDWIALSLDSSRAGQLAYHMFVNPSGVQMDALNSGSNGEDTAPDWVWQSAGRVVDEGYVVEIRLPLESIRFRGGSDVTMGVMFFRRMSRRGVSWSWPEMPPGTWVFEAHVPVVFDELHQPRLLEVIPSATMSRTQTQSAAEGWNDPSARDDLGVSVKYGLTSTITLDGTVNPDFSQVESDAFQVEINQRFPVFFSEKRPFFMEGLGLFNLAGAGGDSSMRTTVHTRRIIDPEGGVKLTGTAGRETFALLSASDGAPVGARKVFTIGRGIHNFGEGQYAGALVTDVEFGREYNRVVGGDLALRHGDFRWNAALLSSHSRGAAGDTTSGVSSQASYSYFTRRYGVSGQIEHYDRDFRMDTAFFNRTGFTRGWQYGQLEFYPDQTGQGRLKRVSPFLWVTRAEDRIQGGSDQFVLSGLRLNFTRQGYLQTTVGRGHETFAGRRFTTGQVQAYGQAQFTRWLNLSGSFNSGRAVFYDPTEPFGGTRTSVSGQIGVQPNANLSHSLSYNFVEFAHGETGLKVFDVHIVNFRNTYQFNRQFLVRVITQLDTSRRRVLGDFLASYELVPGTVIHVGYGTILESLLTDAYSPTTRALFIKASYLARL